MIALCVIVAACLLATASATASTSVTYTWNKNTDWNNPANWFNGTMPSAGDIVTFPAAFAAFGIEQCTGTKACQKGATLSLRPVDGLQTAEVTIHGIELPLYGTLQIFDGSTINFADLGSNQTAGEAAWLDKSALKAADFMCAANWYVAGTTKNPNFQVPCYTDKVHFDDVRLQTRLTSCFVTNTFYFRLTLLWCRSLPIHTLLEFPILLEQLGRSTGPSLSVVRFQSHLAIAKISSLMQLASSTVLRIASTRALN